MPTSTRNLTLDFIETQMGQFSSFKLNIFYSHFNISISSLIGNDFLLDNEKKLALFFSLILEEE